VRRKRDDLNAPIYSAVAKIIPLARKEKGLKNRSVETTILGGLYANHRIAQEYL
jgi:hypothetical protein